MTQKEFMSGSELRQYLHISTRKMKYLMDNNYIPHENTGHTTHKYRVRTEDAVRFKARMDSEPGFLSELSGMFSNRTEWHPLTNGYGKKFWSASSSAPYSTAPRRNS